MAKTEGVKPDFLRRQIASGRVAVMQRDGKPSLGIGEGLKTKINANIGTSAEVFDPDIEVEKARIAEKYGADTISDLSMGGDIDEIRRRILEETTVPLTTVPIYQTVVEAGSFKAITEQDLIRMIKKHVSKGISSIVVHAGFTLEMLEKLRNTKRIMGMVSKGGSFTSAWMLQSGKENPFWSHFDEICEVLSLEKNVVLSLGNTMRSGCIHDHMDGPQEMEMDMNAKLARRANELGVQVIIEGMGGHVSPRRYLRYVAHYKKGPILGLCSLRARFRSISVLGMTISLDVLGGLLRLVLEQITYATSLPPNTSPFLMQPRSGKGWWPLK